jgi:hypothetical protein
MSGNRTERRGVKNPEEYRITLSDPRRIAKPLLDDNDRETAEGRNFAQDLERLGYRVVIERD